MAQIVYDPGCEPGNPKRPKTEIVSLIRREAIIKALANLREALEGAAGTDLKDKTVMGIWLILSDIANALELTLEEQREIMGEHVFLLLEDVTEETWQVRQVFEHV